MVVRPPILPSSTNNSGPSAFFRSLCFSGFCLYSNSKHRRSKAARCTAARSVRTVFIRRQRRPFSIHGGRWCRRFGKREGGYALRARCVSSSRSALGLHGLSHHLSSAMTIKRIWRHRPLLLPLAHSITLLRLFCASSCSLLKRRVPVVVEPENRQLRGRGATR